MGDGLLFSFISLQKSANYTCVSSNSVGQVSKSVYVYVIDRGTVELCGNESSFGVNWPASSPGSPILAECPKHFEGQSQRICEQQDFGRSDWLTPNFSDCLADSLVDVYNEVGKSFIPVYYHIGIMNSGKQWTGNSQKLRWLFCCFVTYSRRYSAMSVSSIR